jgi:hypothetical protein
MNETAGCNGAISAEKRSFPMTTKRISMATAALLATTLGAGVAFAQSTQVPSSQAPMKQGGADQPGMMDMSKMDAMMAKMDRMMDNCNRMMESKQHPSSEPKTTAPNKG